MVTDGREVVMVPVDEVLAQVRIRDWDSGFQQTPLKHFKGRLQDPDGISGYMTTIAGKPRLQVVLTFSELDVIDSSEPYISPVAQLEFLQSNRQDSGWGIIGSSIDNILNPKDEKGADVLSPEQIKGIRHCLGKMMELKLTGGHMMYDKNSTRQDKKSPKDAWEVIAIEGEQVTNKAAQSTPIQAAATPAPTSAPANANGYNAIQQALSLLNGKTDVEWHKVVFNDPIVKADRTGLISRIIGKKFLPIFEGTVAIKDAATGRYSVDKDVIDNPEALAAMLAG